MHRNAIPPPITVQSCRTVDLRKRPCGRCPVVPPRPRSRPSSFAPSQEPGPFIEPVEGLAALARLYQSLFAGGEPVPKRLGLLPRSDRSEAAAIGCPEMSTLSSSIGSGMTFDGRRKGPADRGIVGDGQNADAGIAFQQPPIDFLDSAR